MTILDTFQSFCSALADENHEMPSRITLPPRTFDRFVEELHAHGFRPEWRPGLFSQGFDPVHVRGQAPSVELQTTSGVVRIRRG